MIISAEISSEAMTNVYNALIDTLEAIGAERSTAICGLLAATGTQIKGRILTEDEFLVFINDASQWMALYFQEPSGLVQ